MIDEPDRDDPLARVLGRARELGFLGPGPVQAHIDHALAFGEAYRAVSGGVEPTDFVDIGCGGGVPGLVLARKWREARVVLVDSMVRRTAILEKAVDELGMAGRCHVVTARVEYLGRREGRESASLVTARGFAGPAVTAECAAGLLKVGGWLVVSEPPEPSTTEGRWDQAGLHALGFAQPVPLDDGFRFVGLKKIRTVDERFPRRVGIPSKRPLW